MDIDKIYEYTATPDALWFKIVNGELAVTHDLHWKLTSDMEHRIHMTAIPIVLAIYNSLTPKELLSCYVFEDNHKFGDTKPNPDIIISGDFISGYFHHKSYVADNGEDNSVEEYKELIRKISSKNYSLKTFS